MSIRPMVKLVIHDDQVVIDIPSSDERRSLAAEPRCQSQRTGQPRRRPVTEPPDDYSANR